MYTPYTLHDEYGGALALLRSSFRAGKTLEYREEAVSQAGRGLHVLLN